MSIGLSAGFPDDCSSLFYTVVIAINNIGSAVYGIAVHFFVYIFFNEVIGVAMNDIFRTAVVQEMFYSGISGISPTSDSPDVSEWSPTSDIPDTFTVSGGVFTCCCR